MVRDAFNARDFEKLKYLLSMGADPRIADGSRRREKYLGITDDQGNIISWAIGNKRNDLLEASFKGLIANNLNGAALLYDNRLFRNPIECAVAERNVQAAKLIIENIPLGILVHWLSFGGMESFKWAKEENYHEFTELLSQPSLLEKVNKYLSSLQPDSYRVQYVRELIRKLEKYQI